MLYCSVIRDLLPQYKKNTLSAETRAAIEAHIQSCPVCAELVEAQTRRAQPTGTHLCTKQLIIGGGIIAAVLIAIALLLSIFFLPEPIPKDSLTSGDLTAAIFQEQKVFRVVISSEDSVFQREFPISGFYETAMWSKDGKYFVLRYLKDGYTCTFIYDTANRVARYLDNTMTNLIRYYDSAFTFLSGNTNKDEGMHYAPWAWGATDHTLLIFAKGIDPEGYTHTGYFLYSLIDGTIDGVIGFADSYLDIPAQDMPFPVA